MHDGQRTTHDRGRRPIAIGYVRDSVTWKREYNSKIVKVVILFNYFEMFNYNDKFLSAQKHCETKGNKVVQCTK